MVCGGGRRAGARVCVCACYLKFKVQHVPLISQELMSAISSRIPSSVEDAIQSCLAHYANNLTSVLCQFPSQQVRGRGEGVRGAGIYVLLSNRTSILPSFYPTPTFPIRLRTSSTVTQLPFRRDLTTTSSS